jgi:tetratricopeptide (TPR) repeat protein
MREAADDDDSGSESRSYDSRSHDDNDASRSFHSEDDDGSYESSPGAPRRTRVYDARSLVSDDDNDGASQGSNYSDEGSFERERSHSHRSGKSGSAHDDDDRSYVSGDGEDSYDEGQGSYSRNEGSYSQDDDGSYHSQEMSCDSQEGSHNSQDRSYDEDRSFTGEEDDRSFVSGDDDRSHASGEGDRSYGSGEEDDRSYISGEDDRSYGSGEQGSFAEEEGSYSRNEGSDSQPEDGTFPSRDEDSMSLSQLEEGSYNEDHSSSRRDEESADLATELPRSSSPKGDQQPEPTVDENSLWLSQLGAQSDVYSSNSQQQASSSTISQQNRSVSENDDDDDSSQSSPLVEEKSLWLSSLEQGSDDSYSHTRSKQEESYTSKEVDDDPQNESYSNSGRDDLPRGDGGSDSDLEGSVVSRDVQRDEEGSHSRQNDSFVSRGEDGLYSNSQGREEGSNSQHEHSFVSRGEDGSYSNSRGDRKSSKPQPDDSFVSTEQDDSYYSNSQRGEEISRSQLDDSFVSRDEAGSRSNSQGDGEGSHSQLNDSFVSRDNSSSYSNSLRNGESANSQLGDSIVSRDGEGYHMKSQTDKEGSVELDDSFVSRGEGGSHSNSQNVEGSYSDRQGDEEGSTSQLENLQQQDAKASCAHSQLEDSFVSGDDDGSCSNSMLDDEVSCSHSQLEDSFVSRDDDGSRSCHDMHRDEGSLHSEPQEDGSGADISSHACDDGSYSEGGFYSHQDAALSKKARGSLRKVSGSAIQSDSFIAGGDTRHESPQSQEGSVSQGRGLRSDCERFVGSSRHDNDSDDDDDSRQHSEDPYGSGAAVKQRADEKGGNFQQYFATDGFNSFAYDTEHGASFEPAIKEDAGGDSSTVTSEPSVGDHSCSASDDSEGVKDEDNPHRPASSTTIQFPPSESASEDSGNDSSVSSFESFANDVSAASFRSEHDNDDDESLHSVSPMEHDDLEEDVSALSLLPADTFAQVANEPSVINDISGNITASGAEQDDRLDSNSCECSLASDVGIEKREEMRKGSLHRDASVRTFGDYRTQEKESDATFVANNASTGTFCDPSERSFSAFGESAGGDSETIEQIFGDVNKGDFFGQNSIMSTRSKQPSEIPEHRGDDGSQRENSTVGSNDVDQECADDLGSHDGSELENSSAGSIESDRREFSDDQGSVDGSHLENSSVGSNDSDHEYTGGDGSQDGSHLENSSVGSIDSDHSKGSHASFVGLNDRDYAPDQVGPAAQGEAQNISSDVNPQFLTSVAYNPSSRDDHSERSESSHNSDTGSHNSAESDTRSQYSDSSRTDSVDVGSSKDPHAGVATSNKICATGMESNHSAHSESSGTGSEGSKSSASGSGTFGGDKSSNGSQVSEPTEIQSSPRSERDTARSIGSESTGSHSKERYENDLANDSKSGSGPGSASGSGSGSYSLSGSDSSSGSYSDDSASSNQSLLSELQSICHVAETSLRLPKPNTYGGYTREQMAKLVTTSRAAESANDKSSEAGSISSPRRKKRHDRRDRGKSQALLELVANVNAEMEQLEKEQGGKGYEGSKETGVLLTSSRLLYAFEALVGILLQLSDELELLLTFSKGKVSPAIEALESLLGFSKTLDDTFMILKPILHHYLTTEIDEELDDFLYGMNLLVDLLCELAHRVGEKQQWNARASTAFVTMLELLARDTLEVTCIYEDIDTPGYELTDLIQDAWEATGHVEEIKTLLVTTDLFMFRQICYEVILSTDQWCPDNNTLMDICGVDDESDEGQVKPNDDDILSPPPEAALQILEKIHGDPLPRTFTMASVLRRILPAQAITDPSISENFARIRNTIRNPLGMPPSSLVTITSIPETLDDPDALGVAGVGKTTLAAMVANHDDVRRFFNDGIAWIYVGETELNYNRYVQCLQDLLSQLEVDEDEEPLFPELLHIPGESYAMRRRREEGFMIYLRETMVEFLRYRNVLVILDDVCFEPDLDWFDFAPAPVPAGEEEEDEGSCAILITSRRRNLLPPADTVEVDMLDEDEGVELLIKESGELSRALIADAPETKSVVLECACHPLTIKSVGRWLNLKHATAGAGDIVEEIHDDVVKSMDRILKSGLQEDSDMMYEILNMSFSPAINGEPTSIIKFCFAAFVRVFCERKHISDFALADSTPIVPMATTELLFEALLDLEEESLLQEGSLFYAQKKEAATLIPEALSALGVFKVIITYAEAPEGSPEQEEEDEKYLQIMHRIQQEYGEYLYEEDETLTELTKDGERRWNKAFAKAFLARDVDWDTQAPDAGLDYALEMLPSHMLRGGMLTEAGKLLRDEKFVRGRLFALGRENGSRRHIKDCETLFDRLVEIRAAGRKKVDPKAIIRSAYDTLGGLLKMDEDEYIEEEGSPEAVEVGRCHFEIGFSLAGRRCWEGVISHWESSQEYLVSSLGMVELVAGILYNIGVVYAEMHEYEQALGSLKQCLRIRGAIHGEEHILYAQTIQKIGDVFLGMSDYHEAMESYNWALDVMHIEPSHHRIDIGDILEQMGKIHYSKGEIEESLQSFQDALRSKQVDLGENHPELATIFHQIGNCLSNQGRTDEAIAHLEEAIRLKKLDPEGGYERDSEVLTIEGILKNLNNMQKEGLECYEKALQILVTKVPHKQEKVASLLHLIGCVYLMSGEHKKAMKLFEESLHARRKVLGFVHLDVASTLFNMAFLHQSRNRLDKALKCLEEALKIRQLRLPDSEKVAVTHEKIGNLARGIGKTKKAENAFTEALRIRKIIHGNSHEAVATVLQELGDLMDDLGEYEEAMKHYVEALEIRENRLGPDDLSVAETYYSMGFTLQNNGALDRALQCLEESLSIRKFQLGDDSKDVGDTLNMMGFLQAKRGELDDALSLLWDALRIRKLQEDHVKVSETLNNIGNVHREKQEYDLAIECYEECLRIRRAELGDEHEKVADALIAMGNVQSDMEYTEEAMDSYKEGTAFKSSFEFQTCPSKRTLTISFLQHWRSETCYLENRTKVWLPYFSTWEHLNSVQTS